MASILAIVSKKIFESDATVKGRLVGLGDVWPTDAYVSKNPNLRKLDEGGSLFLATVRPPDERLWLVAILEEPTFDGSQWAATPNEVPVTDITALIPTLRFSTGKGITAKPGRLGMSLQTPRALADDDVAALRAAAKGKKTTKKKTTKNKTAASPIGALTPADVADPVAAARSRVEPAITDELAALAERAKAAPARAGKAIKAEAKALGKTPEAVQLLDWGAELLREAGNRKNALACFKNARTLERKLKLDVAEAERLAAYLRMAEAGMLDAKAFAAYAKDLAKTKNRAAALALPALFTAWLTAIAPDAFGYEEKQAEIGTPTVALFDAFEKLGKAIKHPTLASELAVLMVGRARYAAKQLWSRYAAPLGEALKSDEARAWLLDDPKPPTPEYRELLEAAGLVEALATDAAPTEVAQWLGATLSFPAPDADYLPWVERIVPILAPAVGDHPIALHGMHVRTSTLDILLEHGLRPVPAKGRGLPTVFPMSVPAWAGMPHRRPLTFLAADEALGPRLTESLHTFLRVERSSFHDRTEPIERAAAAAGFGPAFDALEARYEALLADGTLADLELVKSALDALLVPGVLAHRPRLAALAAELDLAQLLCHQLRAGILDEWGWPDHDALFDRHQLELEAYSTDGPFPYLVVHDHPNHRVFALGPDGLLLEAETPEVLHGKARSLRYAPALHDGAPEGGDVLFFHMKSNLRLGRWLSAPDAPFETAIYNSWSVGVPTPSGGFCDGGRVLRSGEPYPAHSVHVPFFFETDRVWRGRDELDLESAEPVGKGLPAWLAEHDGKGRELDVAHSRYYPVPARAAASPLGVRDGQYGLAVWEDANGIHAESLAGHRHDGRIDGHRVVGFFRFPGRDGVYVITHDGGHEHQTGIFTPDASHAVVPPVHGALVRYWQGAPHWLSQPYWHYLEPRDPEGSRALSQCTLEQARTLLAAATEEMQSDPRQQSDAKVMPGDETNAVLVSAPQAPAPKPADTSRLAAAVAKAFPAIAHPRLSNGVAAMARTAVTLAAHIERWRAAADRPEPGVDADAGLRDPDVPVVERLFGRGWSWGGTRFEASIRDADRWLAEALTDPPPALTKLTGSRHPWELVAMHGAAMVRRLLSPGTPSDMRDQLAMVLLAWADTTFADEPDRHRLVGLRFGTPPRGSAHDVTDYGAQLSSKASAARYVLRTRGWNKGGYDYAALERRADPDQPFVDPPDAAILYSHQLGDRWTNRDRLKAALDLYEAGERIPFDPAIVRRIAEETGLVYPSAALLWAGAIAPFEVDAATRKLVGSKKAEIGIAGKDLPRGLDHLYEEAMPPEPHALMQPTAKDSEGLSPVDRLIAAWLERYGKREPLDLAMVERLQADFHNTRDPFHIDVRLLSDPDAFPMLTKDETWVVRPYKGFQSSVSYMRGFIPPGWPKHSCMGDEDRRPDIEAAFSGFVLRYFLRFVPWGHLELPVGHPLRKGLHRMSELVRERLQNPELLLLAGAVDLSEQTDPERLAAAFDDLVERFDAEPYRPADGGEGAEGTDRGDLVVTWPKDVKNSLFIAFRPAEVTDPDAFARMARDLGVYDVFQRTGGGCTCGLNFGNHPVVDITELPHFLVWASEGYQRLVTRLGEAAANEGAIEGTFEADPRVSVPELVAEVSETLDLNEDAAALYLQLMTLPDPSVERIRRYDGWSKARYDDAARALLRRVLIVQARYDGTKREHFLPEEIAFPAAPAVPLEQSKLALYGLEENERGKLAAPYGVVLPLRPLDELFTEAWSRRD